MGRAFHAVLLGKVPVMDAHMDDAARCFVTLVDELYDRNVNLVCTADAAPPALYAGERLAGAFARTTSRLIEMRSEEYLARGHRDCGRTPSMRPWPDACGFWCNPPPPP